MIYVLTPNVLWSQLGPLKLILSSFGKKSAIFTIKLVGNNSNKNLILHQNALFVLFKSDIKFEGAIMSTPGMITLIATELKKSFLNSFNYEEFIVVPLHLIIFAKEPGKCLLRGPFNRDPL
jgi:hypothetical protein